MSVIRFGGFQGEIPRIHPRLLPEGNAQVAKNTRLDSGALEALKDVATLQAAKVNNSISLYRYSSTVWLESQNETDWVNYPIAADDYNRLIYVHENVDELRVTDSSQVGTGGAVFNYWLLEVPAPEQGFSATVGGTADDEDEVPETRYYVCTFVNSYGAEGPPSPPTNQVEWRSGQYVILEGLPAVPTGQYNITHRRIYRVNTGSSANTNYQYVTEIAIAQSLKSISAITQAFPPVVTTTADHGFTTGQEIIFTGLGLGSTKPVVAVQRINPARISVNNHGYSTGDWVAFANMGATHPLTGNRYQITRIDAGTFSLTGVDGSTWPVYSSGGTVAQVFGMDELDDNRYFITVIDDTRFSLNGVDATGYETYREGGQAAQVTGTTYTDQVASANLGEVLPTEIYDPPNPATKGLREHPAGFLVGFFDKTLCFSEIGAPHAWPIDYRLATNHDIIGVGVYGNTVAVTTKGWPYLAVGSDPAAMTMIELEIDQSCASKRGIVDFGTAIAYPSPDGLILIGTSGAQNVTSGIFTRDQWNALNPSSFLAFNWEARYLCFYNDGAVTQGFIIDPFDPDAGVVYVDKYATGGYKDIEEDLLYLIIDGNIEKWDQGSAFTYTWKSKPVYTPRAVNMSGAKVIADNYPVTLDFYVDGVRRYTRVVVSSTAFRLPGGFRGEKFEVRAKGKKRVSEIIMATTMSELSVTV